MLILAAVPVALCLLLARRKGGGLRRIAHSEIQALALPILAFLLEAAFQAASRYVRLPDGALALQVLIQYAALLLFAWRNRRFDPGAWAAGAGALCNFAVITLNGFCMPVSSTSQAAGMLAAGEIYGYALQDASTRLAWLGDVIPLAGGFASVGDLLLIAGAVRLLYAMMLPRREEDAHGTA